MDATQLSLPAVVRPAGPGDEHLLAELLASLSATSSFQRFLAGVRAPNSALVEALLRTDGRRGAVLAVGLPRSGRRAVGHASWAVTRTDSVAVADIGVVVADEVQGRGLGTALFVAAAGAAAASGATALHLDVHPDNRRLAAALRRRLGPGALAWQHGLLTVDAPLSDVLEIAVPAATTAA